MKKALNGFRIAATLGSLALMSSTLMANGLDQTMAESAPQANAENLSYRCVAKLPLEHGYSYRYEINTQLSYDRDQLVVTAVKNPTITLDALDATGRLKTRYVYAQPLKIATKTERSMVLDYTHAVYSLNARFSLNADSADATVTVYHRYDGNARVAVTAPASCTVLR